MIKYATLFMVWNKNKLDHYDNLQNAEHFDACCLSILVLAFLQGEGSSTETLLLRCLATGTWSPYVSLLGTEMLSSEHPYIVTWEVLQMPPNLCSLFAVYRVPLSFLPCICRVSPNLCLFHLLLPSDIRISEWFWMLSWWSFAQLHHGSIWNSAEA